MADELRFEAREGIATLTLNRPEKLNAFTYKMLDSWVNVLEQCRIRDDVRVIVITGAGRAFCSGADMESFQSDSAPTASDIKSDVVRAQRLPRTIAELDKPVIAALNGFAVGGGLDIALACDLRFAAEGARLAETFIPMGLLPGTGGAYFLPRLVGLSRALELLWTGDPIEAREAERIGLVNKVFPAQDLMSETYAVARRLAESPQSSVQLLKRIVRLGLDKDLATAFELVAANLTVARSSEDHREAVAAFKEKRKPKFKGT